VQTDRQTDKHDHYNTPLPYWGKVDLTRNYTEKTVHSLANVV